MQLKTPGRLSTTCTVSGWCCHLHFHIFRTESCIQCALDELPTIFIKSLKIYYIFIRTYIKYWLVLVFSINDTDRMSVDDDDNNKNQVPFSIVSMFVWITELNKLSLILYILYYIFLFYSFLFVLFIFIRFYSFIGNDRT